MRLLFGLSMIALLMLPGCNGQEVNGSEPVDMSIEQEISVAYQDKQALVPDALEKGVWVYIYTPYKEVIEYADEHFRSTPRSAPITALWYRNGCLEPDYNYSEFITFDDDGNPVQDMNILRYANENGQYSFSPTSGSSLLTTAIEELKDYWENDEVFRFIYYDIYWIAVSQNRVVILATIPMKENPLSEEEVTSQETLEKLNAMFETLPEEKIVDISVLFPEAH
jgi:hypothetical protein